MRLTDKYTCKGKETYRISNAEKESKALTKLGKLEDKEEKLGIDLNVLLECEAIWFILPNEKEPRLAYHIHIDLYTKRLVDIIPEDSDIEPLYFLFKDYGKTWALTKEELL